MDENQFTTPAGVRLVAVATTEKKSTMAPSACHLCHFRDRALHSPTRCFSDGQPDGEPQCGAFGRNDGREIYWTELMIDPNPL